MSMVPGTQPTPEGLPLWQVLDVAHSLSRTRLELAAGVHGERLGAELRQLQRQIGLLLRTLGRGDGLGDKVIQVWDNHYGENLWEEFGEPPPDCPCCEEESGE